MLFLKTKCLRNPAFDEDAESIAWTDSYVYYMSSDTAQKQRAWELLEWLSGPEAALTQGVKGHLDLLTLANSCDEHLRHTDFDLGPGDRMFWCQGL